MIDVRRLRTLRAVADHRTVTAAAAALYLTPSAVSQQLAQLEGETGHRLLERTAKGVHLTAAGEILLTHATEVLAQLERAEADLASYTAGHTGTVTVASFATGISLLIAPALVALRESAPGIRVRVRDAEGDASLLMLLDGEADIAVGVEYRGGPRPGDRRFAHTALYAEPFDVVLPAGHGLGEAEEIAVAQLAKEPWIGPYPGNPVHEVTMHACDLAGFEPEVVHRSDDFHAVAALAAAGAGVALIPRTALRGMDLGAVLVRPIAAPAPTRRVFAARRAGAGAHPLLAAVLDALRAAAP
jgi:DNA-binding transcriptional LysR family regulator